MVLLYCGTMPIHKLAKDDREGDETHTAVDGLMIVGGSTCTRSGVCVSAASATDIGASKGHGLSCFRVCLVTVVRTQVSQAQASTAQWWTTVAADVQVYQQYVCIDLMDTAAVCVPLTVYLSGEKHMYVYISRCCFSGRIRTRLGRPRRLGFNLSVCSFQGTCTPSRSWISIWFQIAQVHVYPTPEPR